MSTNFNNIYVEFYQFCVVNVRFPWPLSLPLVVVAFVTLTTSLTLADLHHWNINWWILLTSEKWSAPPKIMLISQYHLKCLHWPFELSWLSLLKPNCLSYHYWSVSLECKCVTFADLYYGSISEWLALT